MALKGIVRNSDKLGRLVIPFEIRKILEVDKGSFVEIFENDDSVVLRKYDPACAFCGEIKEDNFIFKGINVCPACVKKLNKKIPSDK